MSEKPDLQRLETAPTNLENEKGIVVVDPEEDRRITRKLDLRIVPLMVVSYMILYLDKATLGGAALFGMLEDLDLVKIVGVLPNGQFVTDNTRYTNVTMIYSIGYIAGVYPWSILAQKFPTGKVCSTAFILWSIIGMFTVLCKNYAQLMVVRALLGVMEACVPTVFTVYITYWWTRKQQVVRSAFWYSAGGLGTIIFIPITWGTVHIKDSLQPWQNMYIVMNSVSVAWALFLFWALPDGPANARFLSDREKEVVLDRLRQNQAGDISNKIKWSQFRECVTDSNFWFITLYVTLATGPGAALSTFSPYVIESMGFENLDALLMSMPLGAVTVISLLTGSYVSRYFDGMRYYVIFVLLTLELLGALLCWLAPLSNVAARYVGVLLFPCIIGSSGMVISLASSNVAGSTKKFVTSASLFLGGCIGTVVTAIAFGASPGPRFNAGFITNTVFTAVCLVMAIISRFMLARENARRDREYGPREEATEEIVELDLTDRENKNFRYEL